VPRRLTPVFRVVSVMVLNSSRLCLVFEGGRIGSCRYCKGCALAGSRFYWGWLMTTAVGCGMGKSGTFAFAQTLAGPQAAGKWTGLQNGFGNLAGVVAPALTGFLVDWSGNFQAALAITAGVSLLSAMSWVFLVGQVKQVAWDRRGEISLSVFQSGVRSLEPGTERSKELSD